MSTHPAPDADPGAHPAGSFDWQAAEADLAAEPTTAVDGWPARFLKRITPPEPWRHRPVSLAALWRYATRGAWASKPTGPARRIGQGYALLLAVPITFVTHYLAWIVARPSRLVVAVVLYLLLAHVGPLSPYIP